MNFDVGDVIANKYELRRLLGVGGMGKVWLARHRSLEQHVALKLMEPQTDTDEDERTTLRRFQIEGQVAAELSRKSRHIVRVTDHGVDQGVPYLVMELLEGRSLETALDDGRLDPREAISIVQQAATGIAVAHAEGVIHRDLKPGNVFLTRTEEGALLVKVLDFGVARLSRRIEPASSAARRASEPTKLTLRGMVLGSTDYLSPEQALAEPVDTRADVWSLAVVAFEALTGVQPFSDVDVNATLARICAQQATPIRQAWPEAPHKLEAVFAKAFARRLEDRYQSVAELVSALAAAVPIDAVAHAPTKTRARWPLLLVGATAVGVAVWAAFSLTKSEPKSASPAVIDRVSPSEASSASAPVVPVLPPLTASASVPTPTGAPVKTLAVMPSARPSNAPAASVSVPPSASASGHRVDKSAIF